MKKFEILRVLNEEKFENLALWIEEAEFGFSHLRKPISSLDSNANVLEVGCGSGILLSMFAEEFSEHNFSGIEPFGDGFSGLKELNSAVRQMGVKLNIEGYEQYQAQSKYDFIYCVNVFEHVDDWRHFLSWAVNNLKEGGEFFVLCPNYGFPYEPHFKIPKIFSKKLTYKVFKNYIKNFEQENQCLGLWNSLNLVKKSEITAYCKEKSSELNVVMRDDISIVNDMIERLSKDAEFRRRQNVIGKVARILNAIGVLNLIKKFPYFLPYMKLSFKKT